jgi:hypothetical protein
MSTFGQILRLFTNKNDSKKLSSVYHVHQTPLTLDLKQAFVPIVKKFNMANHAKILNISSISSPSSITLNSTLLACSPSESVRSFFFLQRNYFGFKFLMESTSLPTRIIAAICNLNLLNLNVHSLWYELG